jgi:phosphopantothenoylcysteine decarboxylase/phosphopantothenate--cysteine ligase
LLEACEALLTGNPPAGGRAGSSFSGVRVLVTAGGTREPIDSVRFIGNRSSGRMGYALAREAARRGAEVTLVAANVGLEAPSGVRVLSVHTAADMAEACGNEMDACDVLLMSAAVADFRPAGPVSHKIKKDQGIPELQLEPTEDVLNLLAERRRRDQVIVGFAAEHGDDAVELGRGKLERKRLDAIVVNDISRAGIGFDAEDNEVTILTVDGEQRHVPRSRKEHVARAVLDEVERLRTTREGHTTDGTRADTRSPTRV